MVLDIFKTEDQKIIVRLGKDAWYNPESQQIYITTVGSPIYKHDSPLSAEELLVHEENDRDSSCYTIRQRYSMKEFRGIADALFSARCTPLHQLEEDYEIQNDKRRRQAVVTHWLENKTDKELIAQWNGKPENKHRFVAFMKDRKMFYVEIEQMLTDMMSDQFIDEQYETLF